jgi:hypothetical protein
MPPFHNRSTGARNSAEISSSGRSGVVVAMPSAARATGLISIAFDVRG